MNLKEVCRRPIVGVSTSTPLSQVASSMRDQHVGAIVVTTGTGSRQRVAGIITDRDIVRTQLERTADLSRLSAGEAMTRNPLVFDEGQSIDDAIAHLRARGVRRAPVVKADGTPVGLISVDDLLAHLATTLVNVAGIVAQQRQQERA